MPRTTPVNKSLDHADSKVWRLVNFNPAGLSEYLRSNRRERFKLWQRQVREMNREDNKKKRIQARNLGKSITCADEFISDVLRYRGAEQGVALVGSRGQPTLQYIFEQWLIGPFQRNKFLNFFLEPGDRGVDRKNYEVRLRDGTTIKGRIQGKDGQGFNTVHPNIAAWFDEVQLLSDEAVAEIYGMLGDEKVLASGVPNGVRSSWAYRIDNNPKMGFVGDRMTRLDDPRVTPEKIEEWKLSYGGDHTSGYLQKVMGEWGSASAMTFDVDRITADLPFKDDEYPKLPPFYTSREVRERDYHGPEDLPLLLLISADMPKTAEKIYIHADHGITASPTTIYVSFFDAKEGLRCWRQFMRVLLYDMQTPSQVEVFHYLADTLEAMYKIKPLIGLDTTGQGGQAVMSYLENMGHPVVWVDLNEPVEFSDRLEYDEEYMARMRKNPMDNPERQVLKITTPMKQVAMPHLKKVLYSGELRLVNESVLWKQFENTTDFQQINSQDRKYVTDYTGPEGGQKEYNHDLQSFEVLGAMLYRDLTAVPIDTSREMWIEDVEVFWGRQ